MPATTTVVPVNGVRLHCEERGAGAPILCIHGGGSSALLWADAAAELSRLGRVITYDRRGCGRSERPEPYERTSVEEQAADAAGLLTALAARPAVVVGRSYGGWVATELALGDPEGVRALVLLEPDAPGLSGAADEWVRKLDGRLREVAARHGVEAVAQALIEDVAGADAWRSFSEEVRRTLTHNGPALLAELAYEGRDLTAETLSAVEQPVLILRAAESPPEFHEAAEALAAALPDARTELVEGGHLIDPAHPAVLAFVEEVLD